ncbi:NAD-dependent epimerase/dehydratase family protein [Novosphingobium sp.]|uniref:NAD-dependent epimerase/dehydratase family protein n=1 Tax=Novosphingobium sp. TaxID=1874826 RepID=UPI0035B1D8D3
MTKKILLTGATGFLGRHARPVLEERYGAENVASVCSADYDLMQPDQVRRMFDEIAPDVVVHLAAYSGGIGANRAFPADFYFRNTILTALTFEEAARRKVDKLVYTMGGCSYPAKATSPIDEDQLFCGYPQPESAGYSTAKMMGVVAARSYRDQYGLNATVLIPGNLYGEFDNFRNSESHVVPAMVRRYFEAMRDKVPAVEMWGTGAPTRDFTYAGDVARMLPFFIESYDEVGPVNLCTATSTSIRTLAETIARLVNYQGEIRWDETKPDGQMIKIFSNERMKALGLTCETPLEEGLRRTIAWLEKNYDDRGEGLRL